MGLLSLVFETAQTVDVDIVIDSGANTGWTNIRESSLVLSSSHDTELSWVERSLSWMADFEPSLASYTSDDELIDALKQRVAAAKTPQTIGCDWKFWTKLLFQAVSKYAASAGEQNILHSLLDFPEVKEIVRMPMFCVYDNPYMVSLFDFFPATMDPDQYRRYPYWRNSLYFTILPVSDMLVKESWGNNSALAVLLDYFKKNQSYVNYKWLVENALEFPETLTLEMIIRFMRQ